MLVEVVIQQTKVWTSPKKDLKKGLFQAFTDATGKEKSPKKLSKNH